MTTCKWPLNSSESLEFTVYDTNATWNRVGGLYIFAYIGKPNNWYAAYVGQTDDFSSRIPSHERWNEAVRLGATHIHALLVPLAANRDKWEKMLIQYLQPPLNIQDR